MEKCNDCGSEIKTERDKAIYKETGTCAKCFDKTSSPSTSIIYYEVSVKVIQVNNLALIKRRRTVQHVSVKLSYEHDALNEFGKLCKILIGRERP